MRRELRRCGRRFGCLFDRVRVDRRWDWESVSPGIPEPLQQIFNVFQALKAFDSTKVLKIEAIEEFLQTAIGKRVVSERKCKFALFEISGPESEGAFRSAEFEPEFSVAPFKVLAAKWQSEFEFSSKSTIVS